MSTKTYYVSTTGLDTNMGISLDLPKLTIASAIQSASNGDTIEVAAGTYNNGRLNITKSLTLRGNNYNKPAANGSGTLQQRNSESTLVFSGDDNTIWPMASFITIEGFTLQNGHRVIRDGSASVFNNVIIRNNIIKNTATSGVNEMIQLYGSGDRPNWQFSNNKFEGNYSNATILLHSKFTNVTIQNNDFMGFGNRHIFGSPSNMLLKNNYFSENSNTLINMNGLNNPTIENNTFRVNTFGLQLTTTNGGVVKNNTIIGVSPGLLSGLWYFRGIDIFGTTFSGPTSKGLIIENNTFTDFTTQQTINNNDQYRGIHIRQGAEGITIRNNTFTNCHSALGIVSTTPAPKGIMMRSNIFDSVILSIKNLSTENVFLSNSNTTGPSKEGPTINSFYVSNSGFDTNYGFDSNTAFLTISNAITKSFDGDTIEVAAGTYSGNFDINKNITLIGPNFGKNGNTTDRVPEAILSNTKSSILKSATIDGFKFYHTSNISDALIVQSNATIQNCIFERNADTGGNPARAITTSSDAENYKIANNLFTGSLNGGLFGQHKTWNSGMFLNNNGKVGTIQYNTFSNCRTAINVDDDSSKLVCIYNEFTNCGSYISYGGIKPPLNGMTTQNNIFNISNLGSTLINCSNVSTSFKTDITINSFKIDNFILTPQELSLEQKFRIERRIVHNGVSNKNGFVRFIPAQQFVIAGLTTISKALNIAENSGETIYISAGTYVENVILNKSVILQGDNKNTTTMKPFNSSLTTINLIDGSSGSSIKGMTIKGRYESQTTSGGGNSNNNESAILFTNTTQEINNVVLEDLIISNASNGISFSNTKSNNINIKNCLIKENEGNGIRIASNTTTMNGFTVEECIIENNNLTAFSSNPIGNYNPNCTNYLINKCTINNNNKLTVNHSHDISIFGFNGNLQIKDTTINSNHFESKQVNSSSIITGGWGMVIFGSDTGNSLRNSGNITIDNVTMTGNVIKSCVGIDRYANLGEIGINNFNVKDYQPNKAGQTWPQLQIGHTDPINIFNLSNTQLRTLMVTKYGDINAKQCSFYHISSGILLDKKNTDNVIQITTQIYDRLDNGLLGGVSFNEGNSYVSPNEPNGISNSLMESVNDTTLNLIAGSYTINQPVIKSLNNNTVVIQCISNNPNDTVTITF